jgi:hypothetical protein
MLPFCKPIVFNVADSLIGCLFSKYEFKVFEGYEGV